MTPRRAITNGLRLIFDGIEHLRTAFPNRSFTIDGRLVGDVGEVIASLEYDITLDYKSLPGHDGHTPDGRKVQVRATFKNVLTFRTVPDYYLGFKLYADGNYEEVYNGPGRLIYERFAHRKGCGSLLLSFPLAELKRLSETVNPEERIPRRGERVGLVRRTPTRRKPATRTLDR